MRLRQLDYLSPAMPGFFIYVKPVITGHWVTI